MREVTHFAKCGTSLYISVNELLSADYAADKLPKGLHSVKGAGAIAPDAADVHTT